MALNMHIMMKKAGTGKQVFNVFSDATSLKEGDDLQITLNTTNIPDGTLFTFNFTGTNITGSDFTDGLLSNTVAISNNQIVLLKTIAGDLEDLDPETFTVEVLQESKQVAVSESITILGETFDITANAYTVDEGSSVNLIVACPNTADGVALTVELSGTGITSEDFTDGLLTHTVFASGGTAVVVKTLSNDVTVEGIEYITAQIKNPNNGVVLATIGTNVTVNDTSTAANSFGDLSFGSNIIHRFTVENSLTEDVAGTATLVSTNTGASTPGSGVIATNTAHAGSTKTEFIAKEWVSTNMSNYGSAGGVGGGVSHSYWVYRFNDNSGYWMFFGGDPHWLHMYNNGTNKYRIGDANSTAGWDIGHIDLDTTGPLWSTGVWEHYTWTLKRTDSSTGLATVYKNGQSVASGTFLWTVTSSPDLNLRLGKRQASSSQWCNVHLDNITLMNKVLSAQEVLELYNFESGI